MGEADFSAVVWGGDGVRGPPSLSDRRMRAADEAHWSRLIVPLTCESLDEASGLRAGQQFSLSEVLCFTLGYL